MDNNTSPNTRTILARQAGSLSLALWHDGSEPDELGGYRQRYAYRIASTAGPGVPPVDGRDIHSGVGETVDTTRSMATLVNFLSAAGEAYRYDMDHPGGSENLDLLPDWVPEAAHLNSDELAMLAMELEEPAATPDTANQTAVSETQDLAGDGPAWPPGRYYTVVFLQDNEGHAVVDLLEEKGASAVFEHLAQWDFGSETLDAALFNTEVYSEAPVYQGTRVAEDGPYVLTYNPDLGDVHLLREFPTDMERPAWWPDRYTGITSRAGSARPATPGEPAPVSRRPDLPARPELSRFDDGMSL